VAMPGFVGSAGGVRDVQEVHAPTLAYRWSLASSDAVC
jgi:hypothetical protein